MAKSKSKVVAGFGPTNRPSPYLFFYTQIGCEQWLWFEVSIFSAFDEYVIAGIIFNKVNGNEFEKEGEER